MSSLEWDKNSLQDLRETLRADGVFDQQDPAILKCKDNFSSRPWLLARGFQESLFQLCLLLRDPERPKLEVRLRIEHRAEMKSKLWRGDQNHQVVDGNHLAGQLSPGACLWCFSALVLESQLLQLGDGGFGSLISG